MPIRTEVTSLGLGLLSRAPYPAREIPGYDAAALSPDCERRMAEDNLADERCHQAWIRAQIRQARLSISGRERSVLLSAQPPASGVR